MTDEKKLGNSPIEKSVQLILDGHIDLRELERHSEILLESDYSAFDSYKLSSISSRIVDALAREIKDMLEANDEAPYLIPERLLDILEKLQSFFDKLVTSCNDKCRKEQEHLTVS